MAEMKRPHLCHSSNTAIITALGLAVALVLILVFMLGLPSIHAQTQPSITAVSPNVVTVGAQDVLTITGSEFEDTPTVTVDSQVLVDVAFVSTTTLTATVPVGLPTGVYTVTVTNPGGLGDSLSSGLTVQNPVPLLNPLNPASGPNNLDTQLVITGAYFVPTPTVTLGSEQLREVVWVSSTRLTASLPWGFHPGTYDLLVANPGPGAPSAALANAFTVTQAIGVWTTEGPYGGSVHRLAMDESVTSTLYASLGLAGSDGFFKTTDGGESWYNAFPGKLCVRTPLAGFALKPGDPQTIYLSGSVGQGDQLYRSTDGGESWEEIWEGGDSFFYAIGVSPGDPEYVYAGRGSTIVLSTDGGDTWAPADGGIPDDAEVSILTVHPVTPDIAYAGIEPGHVYKTVDRGENWTLIADLGEGWWSFLAIDPHAPERVYASGWHTGHFFARSLNGGDTWEAMTLEPGQPSANDIAFHPTISGTMYVIAPGVYSSTNAGGAWNRVSVPDEAKEGWALLLHPQTGLPYYIGHNGRGVLRGDNGGVGWEVRSHGLAGLHPREIATSPADPRYIYVAADEGGGFISNDGGQSWLAAEGSSLDRGISVAAHPHTPTVAYLGARRAVFKTVDGGQTWTRHNLPGLPMNNEMRVHAIAIDPDDPRVMYAGPGTWDFTGGPEYGWLYRSLDEGDTWSLLSTTYPISPVTDIEIDPIDSQTIYVATGRRFLDSTDRGTGVLKTADGGETWGFVNQGLSARSISQLAINPDDPTIVYAGAVLEDDSLNSGVYKSVDGGQNWVQVVGEHRISGLEIDPVMTDTVYMGAYGGGLFRSTDGGTNWEHEEGPLGLLPSESLRVTAATSRTIIHAGVVGDLLNGDVATTEAQFYGGGVYQLTIDRRTLPYHVYLPLVVKDW